MKSIYISCVILFCSVAIQAQQKDFSVYLIGDCGKAHKNQQTLISLEKKLNKDDNSAVIFLGDNIYSKGLTANSTGKLDKKPKKILNHQLDILYDYEGQAYFVPGNHDWKSGKSKGAETLKNQEVYVNKQLSQNTYTINQQYGHFYPNDGLPGPTNILLNGGVRVLFIDTQWWLHQTPYKKVNSLNRPKYRIEKEFFVRLNSILKQAEDNNEIVLIAAHHPLITDGDHSKKRQPFRFLNHYTPFQLFGLIGLNRLFIQDTAHPKYKRMVDQFLEVISPYNNVIYASGHDHSLQYHQHNNLVHLVSGAGSKSTEIVQNSDSQVYATAEYNGYMKLIFKEKATILQVINGQNNKVLFKKRLKLKSNKKAKKQS